MTHLKAHTQAFVRTAAIGSLLALLPWGCISSESKGTAANAGGKGAVNTAGGGISGLGNGGQGGVSAAGTTIPSVDCASDVTCTPLGLLCNKELGKCAACNLDADCGEGVNCVAGICGGSAGCTANADCASAATGPVCDVTRGRCVACDTAADCAKPDSSLCTNQQCVPVTPCTNSLGCTAPTPVCDTSTAPGHCVACTTSEDCVASGTGLTCANSQCVPSCTSSDTCTGGLLCNTSGSTGFCAECAADADCAASEFCSNGTCTADVCTAGIDQACLEGGIALCNASGSGFSAPEACAAGKSCSVSNSRATCGAAVSGCANNPGTAAPCTEIPAFTGTQTVDAKGDDFCSVPAFEFSFANAAGVNNNKVTTGSTADYAQYAVARVAWSTDAIHAFIEVYADPVRANSDASRLWDGDSVELMLTTNNNPPGLTSEDNQAIHVIANYAKGALVKSNGESGTATEITDSSQLAVGFSDNGYVIELKLPWPGTAPVSGAAVRFNMALNVDTEAVDPDVWGRDAQAVLAMATLSGPTTCSVTDNPTPFCDERLWCATKLK